MSQKNLWRLPQMLYRILDLTCFVKFTVRHLPRPAFLLKIGLHCRYFSVNFKIKMWEPLFYRTPVDTFITLLTHFRPKVFRAYKMQTLTRNELKDIVKRRENVLIKHFFLEKKFHRNVVLNELQKNLFNIT